MTEASDPARPSKVRFHYIKSSDFRVVHVDGAHGGVTPSGYVQMSLYSERLPIPRVTVQAITPEGKLGTELADERVSRDGPVREVEICAVLDFATAVALRDWLGTQIDLLRALKEGRHQ
ncbi:MAG: hypothetical protein OZ948_15490 [Deltaproteobacteria bacterium]|nr:hypothetical protein [Deltaproteobacteria bacterium]